MKKKKKPATAKQLEKAKAKIRGAKERCDRHRHNSSIAADALFYARIAYLKLAGWEVSHVGRWHSSVLCRRPTGATWYSLYDAEIRQRRRERKVAERERKAKVWG